LPRNNYSIITGLSKKTNRGRTLFFEVLKFQHRLLPDSTASARGGAVKEQGPPVRVEDKDR
jgi:hypothetical protein